MREPKLELKKIRLPRLRIWYRLLLYAAAAFICFLTIAETTRGYLNTTADIVVYVAAAFLLLAACGYLVRDICDGIHITIRLLIEGSELANRIYSDYRYRTVLSTYVSFSINLFYAASNGILAIVNHSPWLGTLAAYYIFLSVMRFGIIRRERKLSKAKRDEGFWMQELRVYRNTGILLALVTVALCGAVILLLHQEGGYSYQGYLIFLVAFYTFYKAIISVVNVFRARRLKSPLVTAVRNIGYAEAAVSVLALQTAMFASFGENSSIDPLVMNGATGACVCLMTFAIGIYMIVSSGRKRKQEGDIYK